jgi:hypothetical protein
VADLVNAPATTSATPEVPYVAGFWKDPQAFKIAASAARDAGHTGIQAYMPYPIHGIEAILGLERSFIGRPVFAVSILFFLVAYQMQYHQQVVNFPMIYGGKPFHSWQLFVVVTLETGLLIGALVNLLLCFHTCRLVPNPAFKPMHPRLSDDTFCIALPITATADTQSLVAWFRKLGADEVEIDEHPAAAPAAAGAEPAHA